MQPLEDAAGNFVATHKDELRMWRQSTFVKTLAATQNA